MEDYIVELLSETPEPRDRARQQALTDQFLAPALAVIETLMLELRAGLDPALRDRDPTFAGKPYPLGQCLQITEAVHARLLNVEASEVSARAAEGLAALRAFLAAGGQMRRAWGDLRDQYFQNALIVGTLYVDVSNDTVVVTKPPVEILPFDQAGFRPIADYAHYARIAGRYWRTRTLPNHLVPELSPYLPLIEVLPTGRLRLGAFNRYMLGLTLSKTFTPAEDALSAPPLPPGLFAGLSAAVRDGPAVLAESPSAGRAAALASCRAYRTEGRAACAATYNRALAAGRAINRLLAGVVVIPEVG
ncbi:hypothetical protein DJ019_11400 [Phenylobacterium kunshanense]|uniref:Uncharacterized protein n=2 Tax=Phenylobacterium kunshanense TaxID=1445034 RepID=A0A328BG14_9CAUL|nr:hypothetical protein DJ019_11400 [Phenylobacterium kunshanense]